MICDSPSNTSNANASGIQSPAFVVRLLSCVSRAVHLNTSPPRDRRWQEFGSGEQMDGGWRGEGGREGLEERGMGTRRKDRGGGGEEGGEKEEGETRTRGERGVRLEV